MDANPLRKALKTFVFRRSGKSFCHTRTLQGSVTSLPRQAAIDDPQSEPATPHHANLRIPQLGR